MGHIQIDDESNDRKYFTMLPNFILNHSTAVDQALYMQMKRFAGENRQGECWASKRTLLSKLGVGIKSLNKSLEYLISREWIYEKGTRLVNTKGGPQFVQVYGIRDIWKMNTEHYETQNKGASKRTPLSKGAYESIPKVHTKVRKGAYQSTPNKNHINKKREEDDISDEERQELLKKMREIKAQFTKHI